MQHNTNTNIPPLPKASSGKRTVRSRGQTYPMPGDINMKHPRGIKNTPTPSNNHTNILSTASKNKFNKFTSPKRKRSESSSSHEERVRSAIRSSGHCHVHMDLRGSFDDLSLSSSKNMSPMSILSRRNDCEPPRSSRRVDVDSPPFSARSDISAVSSNNDSGGSSIFVQSPNATISPQQQAMVSSSVRNSHNGESSAKHHTTPPIMNISSITGLDSLGMNIISGDRKRNSLSSGRSRFRDSRFEQHLNKSSSKKATFALRVDGVAAMPSKPNSTRRFSGTRRPHSSSTGDGRSSRSSSSKKRSSNRRGYKINGVQIHQKHVESIQDGFRSPRPVPPKMETYGKEMGDIRPTTTPQQQRNYDLSSAHMSTSSPGSFSGSMSERSVSSLGSVKSISSLDSAEKQFHMNYDLTDGDYDNSSYRVPKLRFRTPSKPVWRGPSPRDDGRDTTDFLMEEIDNHSDNRKRNAMHINDLNASNGSVDDDDEGIQNRLDLFGSKVSETHFDQKTCDALAEETVDKTDGGESLNNSFESNESLVGANTAKITSPEESDNGGKKVTPSGRPTPDMGAFDRKKSTPVREKGPQCPPTPVRTPSWAHNSSVGPGSPGGIERRNSLDGTKVLFATNAFDAETVEFDVDFENLGILGSGAFSKVFKCRSVHDKQLYAIKKSKRQFRSKRDRARYLEEVQTFQLLGPNCPHVLHYHRAWQENGFFYIQSEFCSRGNLKAFLNELEESVVVPDSAIWGIIVDVCAGLSHIHTHNLVHLDIKPQNIFITNNGTLKIGDFGMVREVGSSEDGHEGDNRYMAPELLESSLKSPAADMFSFGIMMWEVMFNVDPPHDGEEWHNFRSDRVPRPNKKRSDTLFSLICNLLSSNPANRPTSRQVLVMPRVKMAAEETNSFITSAPRKKKPKRRFPGHLQLGRSDSFINTSSHTGFDPNEIMRMREGLCTPKDQPVKRDW